MKPEFVLEVGYENWRFEFEPTYMVPLYRIGLRWENQISGNLQTIDNNVAAGALNELSKEYPDQFNEAWIIYRGLSKEGYEFQYNVTGFRFFRKEKLWQAF